MGELALGSSPGVRSAVPEQVVILCPMSVERSAIAKALARASLGTAKVIQTGIGAGAIVSAAKVHAGAAALILAGVAGGLREVADVPPLGAIVDERGAAYDDFLGRVAGGVTLVGVDRIVDTPAAKLALAHSTGASIVDMESHAFAACCRSLGVRWGVVRGVSDTPSETLPAEILGWITPQGNTRVVRAVCDMALSPSHIPHIMRFARRSQRVLPQVGDRVVELVRSLAH